MKQKKIYILIIIIVITIPLAVAASKFVYVKSTDYCEIGLIDGKLGSFDPGVVHKISKQDISNLDILSTHGEEMLGFVDNYCNNYSVYYYDASDEFNQLKTTLIIDGLNKLEDTKVKNINLSFSGQLHSPQLEQKLASSSKTIFASYNNLPNSMDFPAMYDSVIGVGVKNVIDYTENDVTYNNNILIINNNYFNRYTGNSYLSLLESLK